MFIVPYWRIPLSFCTYNKSYPDISIFNFWLHTTIIKRNISDKNQPKRCYIIETVYILPVTNCFVVYLLY